ncbi:hypothetical protein [Xanthomonas sp. XNM01]|uniref:hypothetical protein n=1 Tax=Xanthomonas sp. XNM01 TaxID=2769289 RepID=UPI00177E08AC|nr:hypothetical protein [Xanthomonas sp. XNM01]MBD9369572.1 hypothetical protein [Xanthomonas sp. XNM01]
MNPMLKAVLAGAGALALGALAALLFGSAPSTSSSSPPLATDWVLPTSRIPDLAALDARWEQQPPWPQPPKPPEPVAALAEAAAVAPTLAVPVGIARGKRGPEAIFSVSGAGELRLPVGGRLPDGGRVTKVSRLGVEWVDAEGEQHEHELFTTYRVQEQATGVAPAAASGLPAAPAPRGQRGTAPQRAQPQTKDGTQRRWPGRS